eukprot:g51543.t1
MRPHVMQDEADNDESAKGNQDKVKGNGRGSADPWRRDQTGDLEGDYRYAGLETNLPPPSRGARTRTQTRTTCVLTCHYDLKVFLRKLHRKTTDPHGFPVPPWHWPPAWRLGAPTNYIVPREEPWFQHVT